eukprot:COSAG01_NODE_20794_length_934_cov_404.259880_2_plen_83_part_01
MQNWAHSARIPHVDYSHDQQYEPHQHVHREAGIQDEVHDSVELPHPGQHPVAPGPRPTAQCSTETPPYACPASCQPTVSKLPC